MLTEKGLLEKKIALQKTRLIIIEAISFESIKEKLPEKTKKIRAMQSPVEFRGQVTMAMNEMEILSELEAQLAVSKAKVLTAEKHIDILRSILSYDRDILKYNI